MRSGNGSLRMRIRTIRMNNLLHFLFDGLIQSATGNPIGVNHFLFTIRCWKGLMNTYDTFAEGVEMFFEHALHLISAKITRNYSAIQIRLKRTFTGSMKEISNRSASYHYAIEQRFEAGMVLLGSEVKSLREGKASFNDSFCIVMQDELWMKSLHIAEYKLGTSNNHDPLRERKLLLTKKEIKKIAPKGKFLYLDR